jgi:uncharacterized protein (TIGR03435 family)
MGAAMPLCLLLGLAAFAHAQNAPRPSFEVASVKLNLTGSGSNNTDNDPGRLVITNLALDRLIQMAFGVSPAEISGPEWMSSVHVDIAAKYPADSSAEERRDMMEALLEDRFKLAVHRETRQQQGYALVVAKNGFKLQPLKDDCRQSQSHSGGRVESMEARCVSMDTLANRLGVYTAIRIENKTGIEGNFSFQLKWSRESTDLDAPAPLFDVLPEVLGLRLQPQKVSVNMVVVDHIERTPTEN